MRRSSRRRLVGSDGKPEAKPRVDTSGTTGQYLGERRHAGRSRLGNAGAMDGADEASSSGEPLTLVIFDHPSNHGHPTYWHARGYGLFAANPLGRQGYDPKQEPTSLTLQPGQAVTFHHRILVRDGQLDAAQLKKEYDAFAAARPGSTQSKGDSR